MMEEPWLELESKRGEILRGVMAGKAHKEPRRMSRSAWGFFYLALRSLSDVAIDA